MTEHEKFANELAAKLGGEAMMIGPSWFVVCLEADPRPGQRVRKGYHINLSDSKKWTVSGCWPADSDGTKHTHGEGVTIGVSKSRGIETLVQEVERRLKPSYDKQHAEMMERVREYNAAYAAAEEVKRQIIERFGGREPHHSKTEVHIPGVLVRECRINAGGSVTLSTNGLPPEIAYKVLEAILSHDGG
jgi:hypothetical protein